MTIEYHNLFVHFVLSNYKRTPFITEKHRQRIEKYITGIVNNIDCKLYAIYANPEHVHLLISRSPKISEDSIISITSDSSARFINENGLGVGAFAWQQTASAFSVSKKDVDGVCKYILNQPEHHKKKSFAEEYDEFINFCQKTLNPK